MERRERERRRAELVDAAKSLFLDEGYEDVGMAQVAAAGAVSRPSVYRYFPGGRAEVFIAVAEALVDELRDRLHHAALGPFSGAKRLEDLLAAFFTYFTSNPAAYRLLFQDVWATRDPNVIDAVVAARGQVAVDIADVVASAGGGADDVLLTCTGIFGCALANLEQVLAGRADGESAWRITCSLAVPALRGSAAAQEHPGAAAAVHQRRRP